MVIKVYFLLSVFFSTFSVRVIIVFSSFRHTLFVAGLDSLARTAVSENLAPHVVFAATTLHALYWFTSFTTRFNHRLADFVGTFPTKSYSSPSKAVSQNILRHFPFCVTDTSNSVVISFNTTPTFMWQCFVLYRYAIVFIALFCMFNKKRSAVALSPVPLQSVPVLPTCWRPLHWESATPAVLCGQAGLWSRLRHLCMTMPTVSWNAPWTWKEPGLSVLFPVTLLRWMFSACPFPLQIILCRRLFYVLSA